MAGAAERRIHVGLVGAGFAASSHLDALSRLPELEVAGLVGRSPERTRAAADRFGIERVYPDLDAMLADPQVDAVHTCTPNDRHVEVTIRALKARKHVLSEKPLAMNADEGRQMVAAAKDAGTIAGVCFNYRHFPLVQEIRAEMAAGTHGPAHLVHGGYLQDWLLHPDDWNWRLDPNRAGASRAMGDIGSHLIDTVEHVIGDRVVEVMADLGRLHHERIRPDEEIQTFARTTAGTHRYRVETEDFGSVLVRFASGARGSFLVSQVSPGRKNHLWFEVDAAEAALVWDQEEPNRLWIGRRDEPNRELVRDPALLTPSAAPLVHYPGGHQEGWPDALRNLFADFYGAVAAHRRGESYEPTFASFDEARHVLQVVDAILTSDRERAWVTVGDAGSTGSIDREVAS